MTQVFQRHKWMTEEPVAQSWVNELMWSLLRVCSSLQSPQSRKISSPVDAVAANIPLSLDLFKQILVLNQMHGIAAVVLGEDYRKFFGPKFYDLVIAEHRRKEILLEELGWIFHPKLGSLMIAIDDVSMLRFYKKVGGDPEVNPRILRSLNLWVPTLDTRNEVTEILQQGGYVAAKSEEGYVFNKNTQGIVHTVQLKSVLWPTTKNWSTDIERAIWDRASPNPNSGKMELDLTDQFIIGVRNFAIDQLLGSAIGLLDLVLILEEAGTGLDWLRVQEIKNMYLKPDWLWATFLALVTYEEKTGRKFNFPSWVREGLSEVRESFWQAFVESRLFWPNPEARLADFSRAYVKLSKGV